MGKQTITTTPAVAKDSKLGTPIADAFKMVNDNFTELYAEPSISLVGNTLTLTRADDSTSTVDLAPYLDEDARAISSGTIDGFGIVTFTRDDATTFTLDLSSLLDNTNLIASVNGQTGTVVLDSDDIAEGSTNEYYTEAKVSANTSVAANTAKVSNANHTGDVEGSTILTIAADAVDGTKIADDSIDSEHYVDGSIDTAHIADDQITHDKLEARYTTTAAPVTTSGATTIDWSTAASFPIEMGGADTLNFSNYKKGQVVDLIINGAYAVTLGTTTGTPVFNKVGTQSYDTTTTNIIQVMCTDDDSTPNFFFAIGTYAVAQPQ